MSAVAHVLNSQPHPRVLLWFEEPSRTPPGGKPTLTDKWIELSKNRSGSYKQITKLTEVDLSEWDAVVTDRPTAKRPQSSGASGYSGVAVLTQLPSEPKRSLPEHLFVFQVFDNPSVMTKTIDNVVDASGNSRWLIVDQLPGSNVRAGNMELDPHHQELRDELVRVCEKRQHQLGVRLQPMHGASTEYPAIESLAFGPSESALAGRYTRTSGSSTWFIPVDVEDFARWWDAALRDWHTIDSEKFPDLPGWIENYDWLSHDEQGLADAIKAEEERFESARLEHESRMAELKKEAESAASKSTKELLVGTGVELQNTVRDVLRGFGYDVRDMDREYPDREPREDYRITEPGIEGWLAIGDATGVARGAKSSKIAALGRYVGHYEREERPKVRPRQWLLINRLIAREPASRGNSIFRDDDRDELTAALGLAIDTVALFVLDRARVQGAVSSSQIRELLRELSGELTWQDAAAWLEQLQK